MKLEELTMKIDLETIKLLEIKLAEYGKKNDTIAEHTSANVNSCGGCTGSCTGNCFGSCAVGCTGSGETNPPQSPKY